MTRLNDFTWALTRLERRDKGESGKRATRTCTKPTSGHNLALFIWARSPRHALVRKTHPNELTRTPSNDLPKRFYMGACTTKIKGQGRATKTSCMNMHKANLGSQLSIFYTGLFTRARHRLNNPPKRVDTDVLKRPDRTILHGHPHDRNKDTSERRANKLHECAKSQPRVTT